MRLLGRRAGLRLSNFTWLILPARIVATGDKLLLAESNRPLVADSGQR